MTMSRRTFLNTCLGVGVIAVAARQAATALVVDDVDKWRELAARLDIDQAIVVDRHGRVEMTPAMRERMHLVG